MKRRQLVLYAAYACLVAGMYLWSYRSSQSSFERIVPYSHTGASPEVGLTETLCETESPETTDITATEMPPAQEMTEPSTFTEVTEAEAPTENVLFPLDLNTVTFEELCSIPGIGEATAQSICDYRSQNGGFRSMAQLLDVSGIGEKRFQQIKAYLYLEEPLPEPEVVQPQTNEPEPQPAETEAVPIPTINLNTATKEQLMLLPGCDAQLAENILYLRDVLIGQFYNPLEITLAEGVTDEMYLTWCPYLAVDDEGGTQLLPEYE